MRDPDLVKIRRNQTLILSLGPSYKMPRGPRKAWKKKASGPRRRPALRRKRAYPTNVNRSLQPIPQRYICKMKYSETVATSVATNLYAFNLNSIYDPNRTGLGHQPYGHDTLATLYNRYRVISCAWRINVLMGASTSPVQVAAQPANELLTTVSVNEMRENPRAKYILQNTGAESRVLKGHTYIPSLVGRSKQQYMSDDRYQAQIGASPLEAAILNVLTADVTDTAAVVSLQVMLEYTVEFFDIKHLAQS